MSLIQLVAVSKALGNRQIFDQINFAINSNDLIALIGDNGAGKSTFLKILAGEIPIDAGKVIRSKNLTLAFLQQEVTISNPMISTKEYLQDSALKELELEMQALLEASEIDRWGQVHEKFETLGGYQQMPIEQMLHALKLEANLLDVPFAHLSTGQKMRFALAKILSQNPDLLLLDEPTNHLDEQMISWLAKVLKDRSKAAIIVSHDRKFLNQTCNCLVELKNGQLYWFGGTYDAFLGEQEKILEREIKAYEEQQEELARLKQQIKEITFSKGKSSGPSDRDFISYDKRGEKHQKSLQHKLNEMKNKVLEIEKNSLVHPKPKTIKGLRFLSEPLSAHVAIELDSIAKAHGNKILFSSISKAIHKNDRIWISGQNGSGKTTLIEIIAKKLTPDHGQVRYAPGLKLGYLDQEVKSLPLDETPIDYFEKKLNLKEEDLRSELHKAGLKTILELNRPFSTMSVGQRKRLKILELSLEKPNVLILDEPTNHLDFYTMEALEKALIDFQGAVIFVSHDATFVEKIKKEILEL